VCNVVEKKVKDQKKMSDTDLYQPRAALMREINSPKILSLERLFQAFGSKVYEAVGAFPQGISVAWKRYGGIHMKWLIYSYALCLCFRLCLLVIKEILQGQDVSLMTLIILIYSIGALL
jgi:hypothetical protein